MINIYVGEDWYYTYHKCQKDLKEKYPSFEEIEFYKYDGYNDTVSELCDTAFSYSFFSNKKVIVFDHAYFFSNTNEKVSIENKQDYKFFAKLCELDTNDLDINFIVSPKLNSSDLVKQFRKCSKIIQVDNLSDDDTLTYILQLAKERNINIDSISAREIIERSKDSKTKKLNYLMVMNNIEKVFIYSNYIRMEDIDLLVFKPLEDNIFGISENLCNGKIKEALKAFRSLIELGYNSYNILPIIFSSFGFYSRVKYLLEKDYNQERIPTLLNENQYRVKYAIKALYMLSYKKIVFIMNALNEIEVNCKFSGLDINTSLELFITTFKSKYLS